jgi:chromosomal replication initiator protein
MSPSADLWDRCLENLKNDVSQQSFETWLKPTTAIFIEPNTLKVCVPNDFFKEWIRTHFQSQIQKALKSVYSEQLEIQFDVDNSLSAVQVEMLSVSSLAPELAQLSSQIVEKPRITMPTPTLTSADFEFALNPKFTFDKFVVGNSNHFAHAACLAVAESPARSYNPLFVYGGVGLGKTHLLQAIGNHVKKQNSNIKVLYISSEKFMNDFIQAIQSGRQHDFRNKYRTVDVLLIDDIQFWEGKEATQEEFFHTFNVLFEAQKQIVATSDSHPKQTQFEERLKNRFEMGLITDIQEPDLETRIAILRKKAESEGILVPNEVTAFIANHAKANIRELEGSMLRVKAFALHSHQEITLELVKEVLKDSLPNEEKRISVDAIQRVVAERYNCRYADMKSKKRTKQIAFPRQIAMYLARELTPYSLSEIGAYFGGKDHTTIIHAYDKIEDLLTTDLTLLSEINSLKKQLSEGNYSL